VSRAGRRLASRWRRRVSPDPIVERVTGTRTPVGGRLRRLVMLIAILAAVHTAAAAQTTDPKIDILEVDGALDGTIARYVDDALQTAADEGVDFVEAVRASDVPVVVWVGPPGSRVTGGGVQVAMAADLLAVSPGSVLGGAVPADLGEDPGTTARQDTATVLAELARTRGRDEATVTGFATDGGGLVVAPDGLDALSDDAALPDAVTPDRVAVLDAGEAIDSGVVDLVAAGLPELLAQLDGREVIRADGTSTQLTVDPVTATIRFNNQGLLGRLLHTVSTPTLAYLLLVGGVVALLFEWFQPGFGVAGISGAVLAGLGLYGMTVLPTQWWAFALVLGGLALLAIDLALASLGPVTAAGVIALAAGSWWLYDGPAAVQLAGWLVAVVVVSTAVFFVFIMTTVLRAQGVQTRAGMQAVMGRTGVVRSVLNPQGHVFVGGVLWRAQAPDDAGQVRTGTPVRVTGVADELTLLVEPVERVEAEQPQSPAHQA
jgi:membrane-bound serine protease (ClpP class)